MEVNSRMDNHQEEQMVQCRSDQFLGSFESSGHFLQTTTTSSKTLGTFAGVICPVAMAMFSTLLFLRLGFVLGQAGLLQSLLMFTLAYSILSLTILSICAISTNGAVEGGGAYFMISRALGPEFGGGIGLLFFSAQVVSCALYTSGITEALTSNFGENGTLIETGQFGLPISYGWNYLYSSITLALCLFVCLIGGHLYGKTNIFTFLIVIICGLSVIVSFFAKTGMCVLYPFSNAKSQSSNQSNITYPNCSSSSARYTGLQASTLYDNLYSNYQTDYSTDLTMNFTIVFSVLFSSVTGIMNGANMSGELKEPSKSIPRGTMFATLFTYCTFVILLILCSATSSKELLVGNYNFMLPVNLWPPFVVCGVFAATLSASLGNLIGGSRILYALAKDQIYGIILKPATWSTKGGNPIVSVLITWFLVQIVLLIGSLNKIAPMCSEMFLLSYAMTNLACLALDLTSAPNFRPSFKYFSVWTALLGIVGCIVMCFVINYMYAIVAIAILIILVICLHLRGIDASSWGSVSQALIFHQVRKYLLLLDPRKEHIKFWRPQILLMVANPRTSAPLIDFVNDLKKSGLYVLGHVAIGNLDDDAVDPLSNEIHTWLKVVDIMKVKAFVELTLSHSLRAGMQHLIRLSGLGGMKPNTICFGFYDDAIPTDNYESFIDTKSSAILNFKLRPVVKRYGTASEDDSDAFHKDLTTDPFAGFDRPRRQQKILTPIDYMRMVLDSIKLGKNVCLMRHFESFDKAVQLAKSNKSKKSIDVWAIDFFDPSFVGRRFDETCLFVLQLACILNMVPTWKRATFIRIFACIGQEREEVKRNEERLARYLKLLRINADIRAISIEQVQQYILQENISSNASPQMQIMPGQINALIREQCHGTALLFLCMPRLPSNQDDASLALYLHQLQQATDDLPPTVLVKGLQPVTCTSL